MKPTRPFIIAEAGVNHNGELKLAKQLVDIAAEAGADAVKFQTFDADRLASASATKADYQVQTSGETETQREMLRRLELTDDMHRVLRSHCGKRNIEFLSTGFDIESVDYLVELGQKIFKIPSGEINNLPYLRHIGSLAKDVILSTGMASLGEVGDAIEVLEQTGTRRERITVLHCTSEYPAPVEAVNLRAMQSIHAAFGVPVGYSDHTLGIEVAIAAAALGAAVIEKHVTLDRSLPGPDHGASIEPKELNALVAAVRNVENALGDGVKRIAAGEARNRAIVRKSLVAKIPISAGDTFSASNITAKRPGSGISPMRWDEVLGQVASRDFAIDELIHL